MNDFNTQLALFCDTLSAKLKEHYNAKFTDANVVVSSNVGKKYAKVWKETYGSKSIYAFIDISNGDIYRPESLNKPAKHVRGNIYSEQNGFECCGPYGVNYIQKGALAYNYKWETK